MRMITFPRQIGERVRLERQRNNPSSHEVRRITKPLILTRASRFPGRVLGNDRIPLQASAGSSRSPPS